MSETTYTKKPRKPNWTDLEMEVLAECYKSSVRLLRGKLSPGLTADMKRLEWECITDKVNAVAVSCKRTPEETKKRFQDVQAAIKKKEAIRKRELTKTGGGPPSDVAFKAWELVILSSIPSEAIHGIEGAVDTSTYETSEAISGSSSHAGPTGDFCVHNGSNDSINETVVNEEDTDTVEKEPSKFKLNTDKRRRIGPDSFDELIELKRQRLAIELRKAEALEKIATILERQDKKEMNEMGSLLSLSPVIKL